MARAGRRESGGWGVMGGGEVLQYRYGLSFPGMITGKESGEEIDFRDQTVRQIAQRMLSNCNFEKRRVLYDEYHQGKFAGPGLDEKLPAEYARCELVIAFLCKEYAGREWCRMEWNVIKRLANDKRDQRRVMYLWRGEKYDDVLAELDLDWHKDGFLFIDDLGPHEIMEKIYERYEATYNEGDDIMLTNSPINLNIRSPEAAAVSSCWRLLIRVGLVPGRNPITMVANTWKGVGVLEASTWLMSPKGMDEPAGMVLTSKPLHKEDALRELAEFIVNCHPIACNRAERDAGDAKAAVVVILALPAALLEDRSLYGLLSLIREFCQCSEEEEAKEPPPILLACTERLDSRCVNDDMSAEIEWLRADTRSQKISKEILRCCGGEAKALKELNWWMIHDADLQSSHPVHPLPEQFAGADGRVRSGEALEDMKTSFRITTTVDGDHDPQSLYLSWRDNLPEHKPDQHSRRMRRVLKSGVPLFWMDSPSLAAGNDPTCSQHPQGESTAQGHPLDQLLRWNSSELLLNFSNQHQKIDPPAEPEEAMIWTYLRRGLLFWDDHRYSPPQGSAKVHSPSIGRTDALICPLHG